MQDFMREFKELERTDYLIMSCVALAVSAIAVGGWFVNSLISQL